MKNENGKNGELNLVLLRLTSHLYGRGTKDTKGTVKLVNVKQTDNAMAKNEKDKQKTAHMTQHRKLKNKQHEPP